MSTMNANQVENLGKLIYSLEGRCRGPKFGEVYTAPAGEQGFIAGYRSTAVSGIGLVGRKWFATRKAAQDFAVKSSDN